LQQGHPGVVILALRSGAPLLPVVYYGAENFRENLRRLRRTDFHIVVGEPFYVDAGGERVTRQVRRQMVDEIMYQMAALLPPAYRGVYSDLSAATEKYLTFPTEEKG
jgi:1-acyl-sn-glycerol-3-phosphate acyltransferase